MKDSSTQTNLNAKISASSEQCGNQTIQLLDSGINLAHCADLVGTSIFGALYPKNALSLDCAVLLGVEDMFRMRGGKVDGYDYCAGFMCVFVVDESGKKCTNLDLGDEVWMNRFRLGNNKVYGERFRCK
jgi:hypothetical protein